MGKLTTHIWLVAAAVLATVAYGVLFDNDDSAQSMGLLVTPTVQTTRAPTPTDACLNRKHVHTVHFSTRAHCQSNDSLHVIIDGEHFRVPKTIIRTVTLPAGVQWTPEANNCEQPVYVCGVELSTYNFLRATNGEAWPQGLVPGRMSITFASLDNRLEEYYSLWADKFKQAQTVAESKRFGGFTFIKFATGKRPPLPNIRAGAHYILFPDHKADPFILWCTRDAAQKERLNADCDAMTRLNQQITFLYSGGANAFTEDDLFDQFTLAEAFIQSLRLSSPPSHKGLTQ